MREIRIFDYYSFGYNYGLLLDDTRSGVTNKAYYDDVNRYIELINNLDLKVTQSSIELKGLTSEIKKLSKLAKSKITKGQVVDSKIKSSITKIITEIDSTLDAELNIKLGFILDDKRHSNEILLNGISKLFSADTFNSLPDIAKFDFEEAGKCIAFDRFTAAAFHSLRGTEDVLKLYYCLLLNKNPTESDTWYNFVNEIEKGIKNKSINPEPPEELIINLHSLRKFYRNKTQHPQLIYGPDDSQDLLSSCIKTINQIVKDLKNRKLL